MALKTKADIQTPQPKLSITPIGKVTDLTAGHMTDRKDGEFSNEGYIPAKIR